MPEVAGSAYADATLQQLFDMEVSSDFVEDYFERNDGFDRYRRATGWNPVNSDDPVPDLKSFLCTIAKGDGEHGEKHAYRSPNTDLAGIVLERAGGRRFASLMGEHLWRPMGARSDAMVTVDRIGTARAAGGISATARDLARVGELVRTGGGGIVAEPFIASLWTAGDRQAWKKGDQATLFPEGSYRNYWYETGRGEIAAIGIHGQWIWIDPLYETVIVKVSSQEKPVDSQLDQAIIRVLRAICNRPDRQQDRQFEFRHKRLASFSLAKRRASSHDAGAGCIVASANRHGEQQTLVQHDCAVTRPARASASLGQFLAENSHCSASE